MKDDTRRRIRRIQWWVSLPLRVALASVVALGLAFFGVVINMDAFKDIPLMWKIWVAEG